MIRISAFFIQHKYEGINTDHKFFRFSVKFHILNRSDCFMNAWMEMFGGCSIIMVTALAVPRYRHSGQSTVISFFCLDVGIRRYCMY